MAVTNPINIDSSVAELWSRRTFRDMLRPGFWQRFAGGEGSRSPLIRQTELLNNPGDTIHIQITNPLVGAGVAGDTTALEGSEESLSTSAVKVIPLLRRHAVRINRRANKKSILDLRGEAKMRLAEWGGQKMDEVRFELFVASGTLNGETYTPNTLAADGNDAPGDVAAGDFLTVEVIQLAKLTMYNNRALPLMESDGNEFFAMVCHQNSLYSLKREEEYRDWVREAHIRGSENPFFKGATAMIDGVVLFQHNNVPVADDGAGGIDVSRNILYGAEAFVEGLDEGVSWAEDTFDYELERGFAYSFAFQPRRALAKNSLIVYADAEPPTIA